MLALLLGGIFGILLMIYLSAKSIDVIMRHTETRKEIQNKSRMLYLKALSKGACGSSSEEENNVT